MPAVASIYRAPPSPARLPPRPRPRPRPHPHPSRAQTPLPSPASAAACTSKSLFISEYAEGSLANRYLELANPFPEPVVLAGHYRLGRCINACSEQGDGTRPFEYFEDFPDGAVIEGGGTYLIIHPDAEESLVEIGDFLFKQLSNGDDVFALIDARTDSVVDAVGQRVDFPGAAGWKTCGVTQATKDHTFVRKPEVCCGTVFWPKSAGTTAEDCVWKVVGADTFEFAGRHEFEVEGACAPPMFVTGGGDGRYVGQATEYGYRAGGGGARSDHLWQRAATGGAFFPLFGSLSGTSMVSARAAPACTAPELDLLDKPLTVAHCPTMDYKLTVTAATLGEYTLWLRWAAPPGDADDGDGELCCGAPFCLSHDPPPSPSDNRGHHRRAGRHRRQPQVARVHAAPAEDGVRDLQRLGQQGRSTFPLGRRRVGGGERDVDLHAHRPLHRARGCGHPGRGPRRVGAHDRRLEPPDRRERL